MQCMWFAMECARSHLQKQEIGRALKRLHQIEQVSRRESCIYQYEYGPIFNTLLGNSTLRISTTISLISTLTACEK